MLISIQQNFPSGHNLEQQNFCHVQHSIQIQSNTFSCEQQISSPLKKFDRVEFKLQKGHSNPSIRGKTFNLRIIHTLRDLTHMLLYCTTFLDFCFFMICTVHQKYLCNTFHLFHSYFAGDTHGWRCPGCQNVTDKLPTKYMCFCGRFIQLMPSISLYMDLGSHSKNWGLHFVCI